MQDYQETVYGLFSGLASWGTIDDSGNKTEKGAFRSAVFTLTAEGDEMTVRKVAPGMSIQRSKKGIFYVKAGATTAAFRFSANVADTVASLAALSETVDTEYTVTGKDGSVKSTVKRLFDADSESFQIETVNKRQGLYTVWAFPRKAIIIGLKSAKPAKDWTIENLSAALEAWSNIGKAKRIDKNAEAKAAATAIF